ncbi:MAG: CYTH domain-containing protein [Bacteroidales bacterium]|nr:CYTH domain-containing protein [Bacteroidales bacterium]
MHIETERKFLVKDLGFKDLAVKAYEIKQGYIAHDGGNTVRVRIRDKQGFLTIKGPSVDGISRHEWEREIPLEDAQELFLLCRGGSIEKTRYVVPSAGPSHSCGHGRPQVSEDICPDREKFFEVDVFYGENEGLVMAEIELERPDEPFERPAWLGREVTGDRRFYNSHLLRNPFKLWRETLEK